MIYISHKLDEVFRIRLVRLVTPGSQLERRLRGGMNDSANLPESDVFGAVLGALIMASLDNGISLKNVAPYMQNIIKGAILVAAVGLDMAGRRRS
jgi:hypothetical protein